MFRVFPSKFVHFSLHLHFVSLLRANDLAFLRVQISCRIAAIHRLERILVLVLIMVSTDTASMLWLLVIETRRSRLCNLIFLIVVHGFHPLVTSNCCPIKTSSLKAHICERLLLAEHTLVEQVVCCCNVIVPISFNTFDWIVRVETKLVENLFINSVFNRHELWAWEQAHWLLVSKLTVPGVFTNLSDSIPIIWVSLKDLGEEVWAIGGEKAR